MSKYSLLLSVKTKHEYFNNNGFDVEVIPSADLKKMIINTGLMVKTLWDGIEIYYDEMRKDTLFHYCNGDEDVADFNFKLYTGIKNFHHFTSLKNNLMLPHFENKKITKEDDSLVLGCSDNQTTPLSMVSLAGHLIPISTITIFPNNKFGVFNKKGGITPAHYSINFNSRKTYWKYFVKRKDESKDVYIEDYKQEIKFKKILDKHEISEKGIMVFRSDKAVSLEARSKKIFQLKEKNGGKDRVLVKRLPVASPDVIHKGKKGNNEIQVSEIFINP